ncbi:uncharacterized protein LOC136067264 [Quercus suber]|uniref:uncharacterized protein LOC136067264 n=1 Tax=Quercus suber TaxID=58331 RepID=UPI0032DF51C8
MASLRDLMKNRGKRVEPKGTGTSQPAVSLPPPPPQVPVDLGLKPLPNPKKKRPLADNEEREVAPPKGTKRQKVVKDHRSKRASSTESREDAFVPDVRQGPRTWSPKLELDGAPIPWETSLRNYNKGRAGLVAEITQQVYVAEEWNKKVYTEAQVEVHSRSEVEKMLGNLKEDYAHLSEQLKEMTKQRNSLDAGLKSAKKQAEDQRQLLNLTKINLETERALVKDLRTELQKVREIAKLAQKDAQLAKEAIKAKRQTTYKLGVEEFALGQPAEAPQDKGKDLGKKKTLPEAKDQAPEVAATQPSQAADHLAPQTKT